MHIHLSGNTSVVSKSSSNWLDYTGFPGDVCVAFFNALLGNKFAVVPNPLTKEESRRVYKCNDRRLSGSTKREFQKYVKYLKIAAYSLSNIPESFCYCGDISTLRNVMLNETICDWLFDMSVLDQ